MSGDHEGQEEFVWLSRSVGCLYWKGLDVNKQRRWRTGKGDGRVSGDLC